MTEETKNPAEEEAAPEAPAAGQIPQEQLSLNDLNTMIQIISICGSRGAIRANEMQAVGALHNKLYAFLVQAGVIKPEGEVPGQEAPTPETTDAGEE